MNVIIAGDHYTVELIDQIELILKSKNIEFRNVGTKDSTVKISLQKIIPAVAKQVQAGTSDLGILACGTGAGVEIGANRFKGIRACLCRDAEQAKNARIYDDANILCLGSWYQDDFANILEAFLNNQFDGDEKRTKMLSDFDLLT